VCVYLYSEGMWQGSGRANREGEWPDGAGGCTTGSGGGGGINVCCAGGITVLYWRLSVFLEVMQQGLAGFAEVESPISHLHYLLCIHPPRPVTLLPIGPATFLPYPFQV